MEEGDTYHQLDLLGRAAVGVGGCRVVGFALAAGVHGGRAPEWVKCKDIYMGSDCSLRLARSMRPRSAGREWFLMSLSPIVDRDPQQETRSRDVNECTAAACCCAVLRKAPSFRFLVGCWLSLRGEKPLMVKGVIDLRYTAVNTVGFSSKGFLIGNTDAYLCLNQGSSYEDTYTIEGTLTSR